MITETCCCGATFHTDESFAVFAERAAAAFRENHRHEVPEPAAIHDGEATPQTFDAWEGMPAPTGCFCDDGVCYDGCPAIDGEA